MASRRHVLDHHLLMVGFTELDGYLATPFLVDHWDDDAIGYTGQLVTGPAAADSRRDFGSPEAPLAVPAALIEHLDRLAAERPGPVAQAMADLRRRIRAC